MRVLSLCLCLTALALAGCANNGLTLSGASAPAKPKTIVVSDFSFQPEVAAVDRGYTARLSRKIGEIPTYERKQRTNERVNDEIVATIVATLRQAGLDAQPGAAESISASDAAVLVTGTLRPESERAHDTTGFGPNRGGVAADMVVTNMAGGSRKELLTFMVDAPSRRTGASNAAMNNTITAIIASTGSPTDKLSPDVEGPARAIGRAAGERIVAYAKEQGWTAEQVAAAEPAKPAARTRRSSAATPKPAAKPAAEEVPAEEAAPE
ncbi:hypothetical protein MXD81_58235 [Microbacteriaceae bacterium K1510]|nr:hypothetical protein [Microbacteriaceae bacterium K1510]